MEEGNQRAISISYWFNVAGVINVGNAKYPFSSKNLWSNFL